MKLRLYVVYPVPDSFLGWTLKDGHCVVPLVQNQEQPDFYRPLLFGGFCEGNGRKTDVDVPEVTTDSQEE